MHNWLKQFQAKYKKKKKKIMIHLEKSIGQEVKLFNHEAYLN